MIQSYKDIDAYAKSYDLAIEMYKEAKNFPKEEQFGLISQIKRAATSIPLNIAEGYGKRKHLNEFKRFLLMAIGSCDEMKVLLSLSRDLGFMHKEVSKQYEKAYEEIGRMLNGLYTNWK